MTVGPIPINVIWEYSDRYGLDDLFVSQIQALDRAFLEDINSGDDDQKQSYH